MASLGQVLVDPTQQITGCCHHTDMTVMQDVHWYSTTPQQGHDRATKWPNIQTQYHPCGTKKSIIQLANTAGVIAHILTLIKVDVAHGQRAVRACSATVLIPGYQYQPQDCRNSHHFTGGWLAGLPVPHPPCSYQSQGPAGDNNMIIIRYVVRDAGRFHKVPQSSARAASKRQPCMTNLKRYSSPWPAQVQQPAETDPNCFEQ